MLSRNQRNIIRNLKDALILARSNCLQAYERYAVYCSKDDSELIYPLREKRLLKMAQLKRDFMKAFDDYNKALIQYHAFVDGIYND